MKKLLYSILVVALLANAFFGFRVYSLEIPNDTKEILEKMELFVDVLQQVRANYVDEDEVDIDSLFNSAIKGMVYSLDPFSQFMTPDEFNEFLKQEDDSFGGTGELPPPRRASLRGTRLRPSTGWTRRGRRLMKSSESYVAPLALR